MAGLTPTEIHGFNPRLRTGGDGVLFYLGGGSRWFQSTPPHGRRPLKSLEKQPATSFNPRLRTGGDAACQPSIRL